MDIFDISQTLQCGIAVWPGDPEFSRQDILSVVEGQAANVSLIHMGTHTGTHVDAPLHLNSSGSDVAAIPLRACLGPVRIVDVSGDTCIGVESLLSRGWNGAERVLFRTRASRIAENSFNEDFAFLDTGLCEFLAERGVLLVGTDAPSVDSFNSPDLPAHKALLGRGIVILENLRLGHVPPGDYMVSCLPLKISEADGSPVRAVVWR